MKRRLLNLLTALSLMLCVAAAALWGRSYWTFDEVRVTPRRGVTYRAAVRPGLIVMSRTVLTGRTSDAFSDDFDRGPGWSVQSRPRGGPDSPFTAEGSPDPTPNFLRFRLGKSDGIMLHLHAKAPGDELVTQPVDLEVSYDEVFGRREQPYQRLLEDALDGDARRFGRDVPLRDATSQVPPRPRLA